MAPSSTTTSVTPPSVSAAQACLTPALDAPQTSEMVAGEAEVCAASGEAVRSSALDRRANPRGLNKVLGMIRDRTARSASSSRAAPVNHSARRLAMQVRQRQECAKSWRQAPLRRVPLAKAGVAVGPQDPASEVNGSTRAPPRPFRTQPRSSPGVSPAPPPDGQSPRDRRRLPIRMPISTVREATPWARTA